jgi:hypothetical protein
MKFKWLRTGLEEKNFQPLTQRIRSNLLMLLRHVARVNILAYTYKIGGDGDDDDDDDDEHHHHRRSQTVSPTLIF